MSRFQNKSALAKINKDLLVVQSNGYISVLTFLALLVTLMVLTTLPLNLFSTAPLTLLHSDFLLAYLDILLLSLFRAVLWPLCSRHHWLLTQRFSPLAPFWWNPDFAWVSFLLCVAVHFPGVGPSRLRWILISLNHWSSKCGARTSSTNLTWEFIKNSNSLTSLQICWTESSGHGAQEPVFQQALRLILMHVQIWEPLVQASCDQWSCVPSLW